MLASCCSPSAATGEFVARDGKFFLRFGEFWVDVDL